MKKRRIRVTPKSTPQSVKVDHLSRSPLFARVPSSMLERLAAESRERTLARHQLLYGKDEAADELAMVIYGALEIVREDDVGTVVFRRLNVGEPVGLSAIAGAAHTATVRAAEEDTRVLILPGALVRASDAFMANALRQLGDLVGKLSDELMVLREPVSVRVVQALIRASRRGGLREIKLTQSDFASRSDVRASREKVSMQLKALRKAGIVRTRRGSIEILDYDRLRARAVSRSLSSSFKGLTRE